MKIAIYSSHFHPSIGGMEGIARMLAEELVRLGHDVTVLTDTRHDAPDDFPFPVIRGPSRFALLNAARRSDVVLAMPLALKTLPFFLASGRRVAIHHPSQIGSFERPRPVDRLKRFMARFTCNIATSRYMATMVPKPVIIGNAYDDATFFTTDAPRSSDLLFVGRLSPGKGCDILIDAFAEIAAEYPQIGVRIVGQGPHQETLVRLAAQHGLSDRVTFLGPKTPAELAGIMRQHRIMVIPSRFREPFGIVALEGLASGCVPIVPRHGGLIDAIGPHGLVFENADVGELAQCLRRLLRDPGLADALREGVDDHLRRHTKAFVAQRYVDLFRTLARR